MRAVHCNSAQFRRSSRIGPLRRSSTMSRPTARNFFSTGLHKKSANPSPWSQTSPQDCKNERGVAHQTKEKLERAPATVPVEKNLAMFLRTRRGGISKPSLGFRGALLGVRACAAAWDDEWVVTTGDAGSTLLRPFKEALWNVPPGPALPLSFRNQFIASSTCTHSRQAPLE